MLYPNRSTYSFIRIVGIYLFIRLLFTSGLSAQISVDTSKTPTMVVKDFIYGDGGTQISRIHYSGNKYSLGLFYNICKEIPLRKGIILSTGDIWDARGPNDLANAGVYHYREGDIDLSPLGKGKTFDAAVLEFDFLANTDSIVFSYFFASEEYPEYVNRGVNDVFAFFVSDSIQKRNIALINQSPISINTINSSINSGFYLFNPSIGQGTPGCLSSALQFDGLTRKLYAGLKLQPYHRYHFKMAIADVGDGYFDSAIFLSAGSFASRGVVQPVQVVGVLNTLIPEAKISFESDSLQFTFIPNVEFGFNSYVIPDTAVPVLNKLVIMMENLFDFKLRILGYADNIGSDDYNFTLSGKRAQAIADYLILNQVDQNRIQVEAMGKADPVADNILETGRARNRRVVFQLYKK